MLRRMSYQLVSIAMSIVNYFQERVIWLLKWVNKNGLDMNLILRNFIYIWIWNYLHAANNFSVQGINIFWTVEYFHRRDIRECSMQNLKSYKWKNELIGVEARKIIVYCLRSQSLWDFLQILKQRWNQRYQPYKKYENKNPKVMVGNKSNEDIL